MLEKQDARDTLRVDGEDNDDIITALLEAIPSYIETATGHDWANDNEVHPMAKQTARFILQLWFDPQGPDTERLKRTIDTLLSSLTVIGRSYNG